MKIFKYMYMQRNVKMKSQKCKKTLTVSKDTWAKLLKLKAEFNARSLDEVISELLKKFEEIKETVKI